MRINILINYDPEGKTIVLGVAEGEAVTNSFIEEQWAEFQETEPECDDLFIEWLSNIDGITIEPNYDGEVILS